MTASADWDAIAGALPIILWIVFLALRKRKQQRQHVDDDVDADPATPPQARRRRRHDETPEFQRNYDPIEPS